MAEATSAQTEQTRSESAKADVH